MCFVQDRDSQKTTWIAKFVEEVKNNRMVLPALKQIREIFQLFSEVWTVMCKQQATEASDSFRSVFYFLITSNCLQLLVTDVKKK